MHDIAQTPAAPVAFDFKRDLVAMLPHLRNFARSLARNPARADDLVQDCIVKALANIHRFDPETRLRPWLFTILRNTFYSDIRKRRREVEDVDGAYAARLSDPPRQNGKLDFEDFKVAFAKLPLEQREALTLVGASGCSYIEAASVCGCAVGTIKSRVNRGRRRLQAVFDGNDAPEGDDSDSGRQSGEPVARVW
ncbi:MAG: RNA polymerase sigma-70 factor, ECF subfamily [Alphaproteobacteria bacterium]|nr:MAG: RNA polymerase sigma-70 factor ECF subfamily [Caulobacteraceae bacterium]TPW07771.1 MAG: RNA polymerase sigma-70 factor, ECF subfamily [Alphaproteobacteria bacterium]